MRIFALALAMLAGTQPLAALSGDGAIGEAGIPDGTLATRMET